MGATCSKPEGAFYIMPCFDSFKDKLNNKFDNKIQTSQDLTDLFIKKVNVAMLPRSDFYQHRATLCCRVATVDYDGKSLYQASLKEKELNHDFIEKHCPSIKAGLDKLEKFLKDL